jgi:hypothetical protein
VVDSGGCRSRAEIMKFKLCSPSANLSEGASPFHHCSIAWSISDRSFGGHACIKVAESVETYEIESAVLAPRRICVGVVMDFGVVIVDDGRFWPAPVYIRPPACLPAHCARRKYAAARWSASRLSPSEPNAVLHCRHNQPRNFPLVWS